MHATRRRFANKKQWLAARTGFLTSTDSPSILGVGYEGTSASTVWGAKTGLCPPEERDGIRLMVGRSSEEISKRLFETIYKRKIERVGISLFIHPTIPWLASSLDGFTEWEGLGTVVTEFKKVSFTEVHEWQGDGVPLKHLVQIQHELEVTGLNHGLAVGLSDDELMIRVVPRNQKFIDALLDTLTKFWACVQERRQPTIDGSYATTKFLQRLHPDDNGVAVWLPESLEVVADEIAALDPTIKKMKERQDQLQNLLRSCLGPHTYGVLPNSGRVFSWKTQEMAEHVRKASKSRVLRTHKALPRDVEKPTITVSDPTLERITDGNPSTPATIEATDAGPGAERKPDGPADGPQGQNRGPDSA